MGDQLQQGMCVPTSFRRRRRALSEARRQGVRVGLVSEG